MIPNIPQAPLACKTKVNPFSRHWIRRGARTNCVTRPLAGHVPGYSDRHDGIDDALPRETAFQVLLKAIDSRASPVAPCDQEAGWWSDSMWRWFSIIPMRVHLYLILAQLLCFLLYFTGELRRFNDTRKDTLDGPFPSFPVLFG